MKLKQLVSAFFVITSLSIAIANPSFATPTCSLNVAGMSFLADYTSPIDRSKYLTLVESAHFTPSVQNLVRGNTGHLGPDLSYTLDHFPNHHLALDSSSRFSIREKKSKPFGMRCTIEGFFDRAIEFQPKDAMVHMLYGMHFSRLKKSDKALQQFELAEKLDPEDANLLYNLGLVYFDLKQYDKAVTYAQKAYQNDFPLDGLKNKLKQVGKWVEPEKKVLKEVKKIQNNKKK